MKNKLFIILLVAIALLGLGLRLVDYDRLPGFEETQDEFFYPWAGMTMLQRKPPVGWSWFEAYPKREIKTFWGAQYPLVSPWLEKPPLYSLLSGAWMLLSGAKEIWEVRLTVLRLLPIGLSFFTIILTGILATKVFSRPVGIIAALLYATTPTMVMANRMSLTENLLTPIVLGTLCLFLTQFKSRAGVTLQPFLVGLGAALAILTKQAGISLGLTLILLFILRRNWRGTIITGLFSIFAIGIHWAIGYAFSWHLFITTQQELLAAFIKEGLPQLTQTIFLSPTIARKEHVFLDGAMLLGYLLLFSGPLWLKTQRKFLVEDILAFPLIFVLLLALAASGAGFSFYGWHVYPVFPFLMILLASVLVSQFQAPQFLTLLVFYLILGSSTLRFLLQFSTKYQLLWPQILAGGLIFLLSAFVFKPKIRQVIFLVFFLLVIVVNIYTVVDLNQIYPVMAQPQI